MIGLVRLVGLVGLIGLMPVALGAQVRLADETDRAAFRGWFVLLADAAFYRPPPEVVDCAALVRYAMREALRPHTAEWLRLARLPVAPALPEVQRGDPSPSTAGCRCSASPRTPLPRWRSSPMRARWSAGTRGSSRARSRTRAPGTCCTIASSNNASRTISWSSSGPSQLDRSADDFLVYHTGPDDQGPGEIRKVRMADLLQHPAPRWRPGAVQPRLHRRVPADRPDMTSRRVLREASSRRGRRWACSSGCLPRLSRRPTRPPLRLSRWPAARSSRRVSRRPSTSRSSRSNGWTSGSTRCATRWRSSPGLKDPHQLGSETPLVDQEPTTLERIASWKARVALAAAQLRAASVQPRLSPGAATPGRPAAGGEPRAPSR